MPLSAEFLEEMRRLLISRRLELARRQRKTHDEIQNIRDSDYGVHDSLDTTMIEQETSTHVKAKERELLALREVDAALARLEDGTYGFCEDTGEEIGENRLRANPVARVGLEAQQDREEEQRRRNVRPGLFDDM